MRNTILLLDKGIIIHRWGISRHRDIEAGANPAAYAVRGGKGKNKSAVAVAFLLLIFLDLVSRLDFVTDAKNIMIDLIEKYTEKEVNDILVGEQ